MKSIRIIALILLLLMLFVSIDFGLNFLWSLVPEANDGIGNFSILHGLFGVFGNHWSHIEFLTAFQNSGWCCFLLLLVNVGLGIWEKKRSRQRY